MAGIILHDETIMTELADRIDKATGIEVVDSPSKELPCIVMQRTSTMDTDTFRKSLQLTFTASADSFKDAHELGNTIVDIISAWSDETDLVLLGRPILNGLVDDDNGGGQFMTNVDIQIPYLAV